MAPGRRAGAADHPRRRLARAEDPPALVDPADQREIIWVSFRPGGGYPFLPAPASAVRDQLVPLDELWGRDGATLRDRLLSAGRPAERLRVVEAALLARVAGSPAADPAVTVAAAALHRGATVAEVGERLGWTRRLARRFEGRVGVTPKRFARVRRFQRLLGAVTAGSRHGQAPDWARLAAELGYHDQAHMIHDFRAFAGLSPTSYQPRSAGPAATSRHDPFLQSAGSPAGHADPMSEIRNFYPNLVVSDAAAAIDFYRSAFGATARYTDSAGRIVHAEIVIGSFTVGVKDEGHGDAAPTSLGGTPVMLALEVSAADATARAATGATVSYPMSDQPYGERAGRVADPFGHQWMISHRIEELTAAQIQERTAAL